MEKGQPLASSPVLGVLEVARLLSTLTDIITGSSTSVMLGEKTKDQDPICEALRRIIDRSAPLYVRRELVPGDPDSIEVIDVRNMIFDMNYARAVYDFRRDTAVPEYGVSHSDVIENLHKWPDMHPRHDDLTLSPFVSEDTPTSGSLKREGATKK